MKEGTKAKSNAPIKCKNMMYVQKISYLPAGIQTKEALAELIAKELNPTRYAVIVHDKEVDENGNPKETDIHAMLCFDNARYLRSVAKKIGDKEQSIERWNGDANNGFSYLLHRTKDAQKKHQYDPSEVIANFDFVALMEQIEDKLSLKQQKAQAGVKFTVEELLNALYAGVLSKEEVEKHLTGAQYGKYRRQIEDVWRKRLQNLAEEWRKEMIAQGKSVTVIWLYGTAGTGKTSLACHYAAQSGQPYYMSGSSRDIFQSYTGEHTIILDELRPGVLEYQDLLRILDPFSIHGGVMAPSRYADKALAADLIIVTSPYSPHEFYTAQFSGSPSATDSYEQLDRRISLTIQMAQDRIDLVSYDEHRGAYISINTRPNPYSQQSRPAPKNSETELFEQILG